MIINKLDASMALSDSASIFFGTVDAFDVDVVHSGNYLYMELKTSQGLLFLRIDASFFSILMGALMKKRELVTSGVS